MKSTIAVILATIILTIACSEEETFHVASTEAYAFSLDHGWELNANANVEGFKQNEGENGEFTAKLSYFMHLVTPNNDTLFEADYGYIDKHESEEIMGIQIESFLEIDSSFSTGSYKIIFDVTDDYTQQNITAERIFDLTKE